jgi:hypothetical protein
MPFVTNDYPESIRQEVYSNTVQGRLSRWLIARPLFNDRTAEFPDGDELKIPQIGQRIVRDYVEDSDIDFSGVDMSRIQLNVTDYVQDAWYMTDKEKQDSYLAETIWAKQVTDSSEAYMQRMEQDVLSTCNQQVLNDQNLINGQPHRFVASGSKSGTPATDDRALSLQDFIDAKLSFDRARVPSQNRVAIIDPHQEAIINELVQLVASSTDPNFNYNFEGLVTTGFGEELGFMRNIYGFNVMLSHELPTVATETIDGTQVDDGVCNIFMSMASADHMPFMGVIRQPYTPEFERNPKRKRDEWSATGRHGFAIQRPETLITILTTRS